MPPPRRGRGRPRKMRQMPLTVQKRRANLMRSLYPRRPIQSMVHVVKRLANTVFIQNTALGPTLTSDGVGSFFAGSPVASSLPGCYDFTLSSQFQLKSVIQSSDLTQLFDRYKLVGVKLKIQYLQNASFIPGQANLPTIHYAFDGDDADVPASTESVLVKGYCKAKVLNANRPLSIYIKPRLSKEIYNSPITTGYSSEKACWLDCNSDTLPHYGLKFAITDWVGGTENNNAIRITPTYYVALKDTQ